MAICHIELGPDDGRFHRCATKRREHRVADLLLLAAQVLLKKLDDAAGIHAGKRVVSI